MSMITLDISIGDIIYVGKFRNKKIVVKTIGVDDHGSPTVNGKSILCIRLDQTKKESKIPPLKKLLPKEK